MAAIEDALRQRIQNFKASTAADHYSANDIVDFVSAEAAVDGLAKEITALQALAKSSAPSDELTQALLSFPHLYRLLCSFLAIGGAISLEDGRQLPHPDLPPREHLAAQGVATVLLDLGLMRLV